LTAYLSNKILIGFCIIILTILLYRDKSVPFIGTQSSGQLFRETKILLTYRDYAKTFTKQSLFPNKETSIFAETLE